ncbi:MAG: FHA domain-containing protein, partial [Anaerolineales bacterium]|nr:FHA domain-containing protein [Anaerolineales bacterium]
YTFSLKQSPGGWALVKWQDDREILFPLAAPDGVAFWNPTPKVDLWDDLVPAGGLSLASWQAGREVVRQPEDVQEIPQPPDAADNPLDATIILGERKRTPSIILVFEKGGNRARFTGMFKIGRDKENDLSLQDAEISHYHAVIEPTAGGWQIRDLNSTNGTWLNDRRIAGTASLQVGDGLRFGKTRLRIEAQT